MEEWFENICNCCSLNTAGYTFSVLSAVYGFGFMSFIIYMGFNYEKFTSRIKNNFFLKLKI